MSESLTNVLELFPFVKEPFKHQYEEWLESRDLPIRALFWEMGTGKSKVIIDTIAWLWFNKKIDTVIFIAKKGEYANWLIELEEHMPVEVEYYAAKYRSAMREAEKERIRQLVRNPENYKKLRILIVNVESMPHEGGVVARAFTKSRKVGMMFVVDESTCVKNDKAARSKAVYELAKFAKYKRIMTGTAIPRSPLDVWGQSLVLGRGTLGFTSMFAFKNFYAEQEVQFFGQRSFKQIVGYKNLDHLQKTLRKIGSVKERADCVDLPPKIYKKILVEMTPEQEKLYAQMREEAIAELGDGEIVEAVNALGIIARLDQIACGQLKRADGTFEIIPNNRVPALLEQLEELETKSIVWCNYRGLLAHLYETLADKFGRGSTGRYYGGVSDDERMETIREFRNKDSQMRIIVANQQSMGYGQTLVEGKNNFYYSNGYNLEHRLQSEDRTMRIGQDSSVLYVDFYVPGTINERVMNILRKKKDLASQVLGTRITDWI